MPKNDIPPDQMQRIQPIVEPLLADLRARTADLDSQDAPAIDYSPAEAAR